jgi:hypothetical protein
MIREYFCEVEEKLEEIAWLIKKKNIEFNLVSEEMGVKALMLKREIEREDF